MPKIEIPVSFEGTVTVNVPDDVDVQDAKLLAAKKALAYILATLDNPDAPEEDSFDDYFDECDERNSQKAENNWDNTFLEGVGGVWTSDDQINDSPEGH